MRRKKRPGIIFYFDLISIFKALTDEEIGQLTMAALKYGSTGEITSFSDRTMMVLWLDIQGKIDRDNDRYIETCKSRQYGTYVRECRKKGEEPVSFEEWRDHQLISFDDFDDLSYQNDLTITEQNITEQNITEPKGTGTTTDGPPTLAQIRDYVAREHIQVDSQHFFDYYSRRRWRDKSGHIISDWKTKIRSWEKNGIPDQPQRQFIPTEFEDMK